MYFILNETNRWEEYLHPSREWMNPLSKQYRVKRIETEENQKAEKGLAARVSSFTWKMGLILCHGCKRESTLVEHGLNGGKIVLVERSMERSVSELDQDALVGVPKRGDHQRRDALTPVPTLTSIPSRFVHDVSRLFPSSFVEFVNFASTVQLYSPLNCKFSPLDRGATTICPLFSCVRRNEILWTVNGSRILFYHSRTRVRNMWKFLLWIITLFDDANLCVVFERRFTSMEQKITSSKKWSLINEDQEHVDTDARNQKIGNH